MPNNSEAYISYKNARRLPTSIIEYLFENSEDIWKLLKYFEDPMSHDNLTIAEKRDMIAKSSTESESKNIILQRFNNEALTNAINQIRLEVINVRPYQGRSVGIGSILFQIIIPNQYQIVSTNYSSYDRRDMAIMQEILEKLNGVELGDIGYLFINKDMDNSGGGSAVNFNSQYSGFQLTMNIMFYD